MSLCFGEQLCFTEDLVYFENHFKTKLMPFELRYQTNDLLSINVTALDMDAARPFNLFVSSPNNLNNLNITVRFANKPI